MILNEFKLDMPYIEDKIYIEKIMFSNNITFQDAKVLHYNNNWKWIRREFSQRTSCITDMFSRLFKLRTDDCNKVIVECVEVIKDERVKKLLSNYVVQVQFNYIYYNNLSLFDKKVYSLELLMQGIRKIVTLYSWDINPFVEVEDQIKKTNYINNWIYKTEYNPNNELLAIVECLHDVDKFYIKLSIKDKNDIILQEKILEALPHRLSYSQYLGKLQWVSDKEVHLYNYNENEFLSLRV